MQFVEASNVQITFESWHKYYANSRSLCVLLTLKCPLFVRKSARRCLYDGLVCLYVYVYVYVYVCYVCEHRSLLSESENKKRKNSLVDCGICNRVSSFTKLYSVTFTYFSRVTILIFLIIWNGKSFRKKKAGDIYILTFAIEWCLW